jgi:hypothetical protein
MQANGWVRAQMRYPDVMLRARRATIGIVALVVAACSAFGSASEDPPAVDPNDAGEDERSPATDAGSEADAPVAPSCLPPVTPGACVDAISNCQKRIVSNVPGTYPFDLVPVGDVLFWLAQTQMDGGGSAYDGAGSAMLYAAAIGPNEAPAQAILTTPVIGALALAYDGVAFYFGGTNGPITSVFRVPRSCVPPCAAPAWVDLPNGNAVRHITTFQPGEMILETDKGEVYVVTHDGAGNHAKLVAQIGGYASLTPFPGFAVASATSYASVAAFLPDGGDAGVFPLLRPDGGGGYVMTSDCTDAYAVRNSGGVTRITMSTGAQVDFGETTALVDMLDMKMDGTFIWYARASLGGLFRAGRDAPHQLQFVASSNVWRIAVTADSVYWGEHGQTTPGAIYALTK